MKGHPATIQKEAALRELRKNGKKITDYPWPEDKHWCRDCKHYCTTECCDHWDSEGQRIA